MANMTIVEIGIEEDLINQLEQVLDNLGISLSEAFTLFIEQCIKQGKLPFNPDHKSLSERFEGYDGNYICDEID